MNASDRKLMIAISDLAMCNPFSPARFALEKRILKSNCEPFDSIAWNRTRQISEGDRPNVVTLTQMAEELVAKATAAQSIPDDLRDEYWNVATYVLLYKHITPLPACDIWSNQKKHQKVVYDGWSNFWLEYQRMFSVGGGFELDRKAAAHLFACLAQIHRAFFNIFDHILGESLSISQLRQKVWESIFTCSIRRYHDSLFDKMRDLSTLITGPSGTGKELVARAIGLSQYVAFDCNNCHFVFEPEKTFLPLNLTALSPTLIESELFGHRKGAFTGAVADRNGWLESCSASGAVFLDEIGELDISLQVKLLRVLQQRTYCRLGDTAERCFQGKIIAATNRDLQAEIKARRFREDFYFRICSDRIETPSLKQQLADNPDDLLWLVQSIVTKQIGEECGKTSKDIVDWIDRNLGDSYGWHGNIRELEQCVRSFIVRQDYKPLDLERSKTSGSLPDWLNPVVDGTLTAEQMLSRYCTWVYAHLGSYEKTSQVLKIDRRTVKTKVDPRLLQEFKD